jgi:hypothetical protein
MQASMTQQGSRSERGIPTSSGRDAGIYARWPHVRATHVPQSANVPSNEYVREGNEASFGSYDVDEATHTVTDRVQGSVTLDPLLGRKLPRVYQFTADGHLILRSACPNEHWSVTWEHY